MTVGRMVARALLSAGLVMSACGSDAASESSASDEVTDTSEELASDVSQSGGAADDDGGATPSGAGQGSGTVTVDSTVFHLDASVQCSIFPGGVVSIAGTAEEDPSIEIVLDVFEPGDQKLRVTGPAFEYTSVEPDFELVVNDPDVSGSAVMAPTGGGAEVTALFSITCA